MLAIRMQRTGRSGYAMFRMVVQDAHRSPTSGKVVAYLGSYDPHKKHVQIDKEKTGYYLEHGAQPSPRVVSILKAEKVALPKWVEELKPKERSVRNPEKRRSTAPQQPAVAEEEAAPEAAEAVVAAEATEATAEEPETENASAEDSPDTGEASASDPEEA